jgi:hypothetical protein
LSVTLDRAIDAPVLASGPELRDARDTSGVRERRWES